MGENVKLSKTQQEVLDLMKGGTTAYCMKGLHYYWWLDVPRHRHVTKTIEKLLKLGLIKITQDDWRGSIAKYHEPS
jgi:hypothetical protein